MISQNSSFDGGLYFLRLHQELQQLDYLKQLCFTCSCVERVAPLAARWSHELEKRIVAILDQSWLLETNYQKPSDLSSTIKTFENDLSLWYDDADETDDAVEAYKLKYADTAIESTISLLAFLSTHDVSHAVAVAKCEFDFLYELSSDIRILTQSENDPTDRGFIMTSDLMKDILSSELIQKELEQEQQDIVLLRDNFPNAQIIHQLRSGSQKLGQYFAEQIKNVQSKLN